MTLNTHARVLLVLGAPLLLGLINVWHPVGPGDSPYSVVAQSPTWWTVLHLLQLPLLRLVALAVAWLIRGMRGWVATTSRVALGAFVVFYAAYDSITGIASGIIVREARHLPEREQAIAEPLVSSLFLGGGPLTFVPLLGMLGWAVGLMAAATALSRVGASRLPVALLGVAAVSFGITHEPPFGPAGMAALVIAAGMLELAPQRFWRYCPLPATYRQAPVAPPAVSPGSPAGPAVARVYD